MSVKTAGGDPAAESTINMHVTVEAPISHAFAVFTDRMVDWWPKTHHIGASAPVDVVLEPRVGGRWLERAADGVECLWGQVLVWSPPDRVVIGSQLTADWV